VQFHTRFVVKLFDMDRGTDIDARTPHNFLIDDETIDTDGDFSHSDLIGCLIAMRYELALTYQEPELFETRKVWLKKVEHFLHEQVRYTYDVIQKTYNTQKGKKGATLIGAFPQVAYATLKNNIYTNTNAAEQKEDVSRASKEDRWNALKKCFYSPVQCMHMWVAKHSGTRVDEPAIRPFCLPLQHIRTNGTVVHTELSEYTSKIVHGQYMSDMNVLFLSVPPLDTLGLDNYSEQTLVGRLFNPRASDQVEKYNPRSAWWSYQISRWCLYKRVDENAWRTQSHALYAQLAGRHTPPTVTTPIGLTDVYKALYAACALLSCSFFYRMTSAYRDSMRHQCEKELRVKRDTIICAEQYIWECFKEKLTVPFSTLSCTPHPLRAPTPVSSTHVGYAPLKTHVKSNPPRFTPYAPYKPPSHASQQTMVRIVATHEEIMKRFPQTSTRFVFPSTSYVSSTKHPPPPHPSHSKPPEPFSMENM
jgi:hypothetical protein